MCQFALECHTWELKSQLFLDHEQLALNFVLRDEGFVDEKKFGPEFEEG